MRCFAFLHSLPHTTFVGMLFICWLEAGNWTIRRAGYLHIKRVISVRSFVVSANRVAMLSKPGHSSPQASSLQSEVTEVEKDLTLRCLLWESLQEWQGLVDQWEATPFETLKIDAVQQDVTRFIQTVFLLEKGIVLMAYTEFSVTGKD